MSIPPETPIFQSNRSVILHIRARAELRELAAQMHGRGAPPLDILIAVGRRATLCTADGADLPADAALTAVRTLPGLDAWQPLDAWQAPIDAAGDALAAGIEPDTADIDRERRARIMAIWILTHPHSPLVQRCLDAVEALALEDVPHDG